MIFQDWVSTEIIPDPLAWYQYDSESADGFIADSVGDKDLESSDPPTLTLDVLNGYPAWVFDGTQDPLLFTGLVSVKHAFILASNDDATFDGFQGLLTGPTLGDILVGDDGLTTFVDLGLGNNYTKEGTAFDEDDQQAPVSGAFRLLEVKNVSGITLDGIQVGRQRDFLTRNWKGSFVEMILFDRILTTAEIRKVRLYFNVKFGEFKRGLPLYFPSADITPTVGPSRFYNQPDDFKAITDSWEYEDGGKDFNEVADRAPIYFEYAYPAVPKLHTPIYDEFWRQARLINSFSFKDPDGNVWADVRIEDYNRTHEAHKRWRHDVAFRLVTYNPTPTIDPTDPDPPEAVVLSATPESDTEILLEWSPPADSLFYGTDSLTYGSDALTY